MNAVERLEAAITKLEALRDEAFDGPWTARGSGVRNGDHWYVIADDEAIAYISANDGQDEGLRQPTAELIATMHRTIEVQLAVMLEARAVYLKWGISGDAVLMKYPHAYAFADAILGGA